MPPPHPRHDAPGIERAAAWSRAAGFARVVVIVATLGFVAGGAGAADKPGAGKGDGVARVEALVRDRTEAGARGDVARWRRRVAEDCVWIGVGLQVPTTAEVAASQVDLGSRRAVEEFRGRQHGDVVIATYVLVEHVGAGEKERVVRLRKLDTYQRRSGDWWLIANAESLGPPPRTPIALAAALLDRYVGEYAGKFATPVTVRVWREGDALMAKDSTSPTPFRLQPTSETVFFADGEVADWAFDVDAAGRARALLYRAAGTELRFERVPGGEAKQP